MACFGPAGEGWLGKQNEKKQTENRSKAGVEKQGRGGRTAGWPGVRRAFDAGKTHPNRAAGRPFAR